MSETTYYDMILEYKELAKESARSGIAAIVEYKEYIKEVVQTGLESAKAYASAFPAWAKANLQAAWQYSAAFAQQAKDYAVYIYDTLVWAFIQGYIYTKAAVYYAVENAHKIPNIILNGLKTVAKSILVKVQMMASSLAQALKLISQNFVEMVTTAIKSISTIAYNMMAIIKQAAMYIWDNLYNLPKWFFEKLIFVKDAVVNSAKFLLTEMGKFIQDLGTQFKKIMYDLWNNIQTLANVIFENIKLIAKEAINVLFNLPKHIRQFANFLTQGLVKGYTLARELSSQALAGAYRFIVQSMSYLQSVVSQSLTYLQAVASTCIDYLAKKIGMAVGIAYAMGELAVEGTAFVAQSILPESAYTFVSQTVPSSIGATLNFFTTGVAGYVSGAAIVLGGGYLAYNRYFSQQDEQEPIRVDIEPKQKAQRRKPDAKPAVLNQFKGKSNLQQERDTHEAADIPKRSHRRAKLK